MKNLKLPIKTVYTIKAVSSSETAGTGAGDGFDTIYSKKDVAC